MNKFSVPLKVVSPKNKRLQFNQNNGFLTLDVNGRSVSPQNLQEQNQYVTQLNKTIGGNYENKKFKIRTSSNSVKTTRNWHYFPFQRIKNVQKIIHDQKIKEKEQQKVVNFPANIQWKSNSTSPKSTEFNRKKYDLFDAGHGRQNHRLKQIQQIIKKGRNEVKIKSKQKQNIIKYQKKLQNLSTNEIIKLRQCEMSQVLKQQRQRQKIYFNKGNRNNLYSDIVKNRRKLSQKRVIKKKPSDYSLLGRINFLNQYQQINFILKNSPASHKQYFE